MGFRVFWISTESVSSKLTAPGTYHQRKIAYGQRTALLRHHGNVFLSNCDGNISAAGRDACDAAVFPGSLRGFKHLQPVTS
jgi:hypothetical protein